MRFNEHNRNSENNCKDGLSLKPEKIPYRILITSTVSVKIVGYKHEIGVNTNEGGRNTK